MSEQCRCLASNTLVFKALETYAAALHTPPFGEAVPSNAQSYGRQFSLAVRVWRRLKRDIALLLTGQFFCLCHQIPDNATRVLYVYLGMPQLGDSIMDLSARTLWVKKGLKVDVLTHESIAAFYAGDPSFHRVCYRVEDLAPQYDFIVLQSYSWKCLKVKWRYFLTTPFLALHGHYYGCEFNRLVFAQKAWMSALGLTAALRMQPIQSIFNLRLAHSPKPRSRTIGIALGGMVPWRTYTRWHELVRLLAVREPTTQWVLLGSGNGAAAAETVMDYFEHAGQGHRVENWVNHLTLDQVFEKLQTLSLVVTADGGLMHLAKAAQTPMVALFAGPIHPRMRFEPSDCASVIHASDAVDAIAPELIEKASIERLTTPLKSLAALYLGHEPACEPV